MGDGSYIFTDVLQSFSSTDRGGIGCEKDPSIGFYNLFSLRFLPGKHFKMVNYFTLIALHIDLFICSFDNLSLS